MRKRNRLGQLSSVLLACTLLAPLPLATVVHAADTVTAANAAISKDDALKKARDIVNLPESDWQISSSDFRTGQDQYDPFGRPTWVLQFNSTNQNKPAAATVTVDATTGQLLALSDWSNQRTGTTQTMTQDDAQKTVEAFLQKVAPDQWRQTVLNPNVVNQPGPYGGYTFVYERTVNHAYVIGDQITINMTPDGMIRNYMLKWTNAQFPSTDGAIDADTAQETYNQSLDMRLSYQEIYGPTPQMRLVYNSSYNYNLTPNMNMQPYPMTAPFIDAKSGKLIGVDGQPTTTVNTPPSTPLDPNGPTEPTKLSTPLTQSDAESVIKSSGLVPDGVKEVSSTYNEQAKTWGITYQTDNANGINATVDAETGELMDYNAFKGNNQSGTPAYSDDQLRTKAIQLMKTLYPDRTGAILQPDISPTAPGKSGTVRNFIFTMLKNGIPTSFSYNVSLNSVDGSVVNIFGMFSKMDPTTQNLTYPSPDNVIGVDKAKAAYIQNRPLRLSYLFPVTETRASSTPVLVYAPSPVGSIGSIDATTGDWINPYSGQSQAPVTPTDIKGHWAEKALTYFAKMGWLELDNGKAHPDQAVTRAQLVHLLIVSHGGGGYAGVKPTFDDVPKDNKYYNDIQMAVQFGWIAQASKFRPNDPITREEVATILAHVEGFKNISTHKEIFQVPYGDAKSIDDYAFGSVAINYGLGVMRGANNKFNPKSELSLAETITALSNLLALPGQGYPMYK